MLTHPKLKHELIILRLVNLFQGFFLNSGYTFICHFIEWEKSEEVILKDFPDSNKKHVWGNSQSNCVLPFSHISTYPPFSSFLCFSYSRLSSGPYQFFFIPLPLQFIYLPLFPEHKTEDKYCNICKLDFLVLFSACLSPNDEKNTWLHHRPFIL